ncbi:MAG: protein phosphatase CheZ [Deltaproteobacteria bacterium]|nr:protein phosphatase CheZ [Deltaproteobacteria bacterium]
MTTTSKPEVHLEISSGTVRITTEEVVYHISVAAQGTPAQGPRIAPAPPSLEATPEVEFLTEAAASSSAESSSLAADGLDADSDKNQEDFFRQLTEELYHEIGALARKLSISIQDLKIEPGSLNLAETGQQLENAKDQLTDIVDMTEQVTMNIMDITDKIQADVEQARSLLESMTAIETLPDQDRESFLAEVDRLASFFKITAPLLQESEAHHAKVLALLNEVASTSRPASSPPPPRPQLKTVKRTVFPLNDLFQILYELCADEDIKKHIKALWNKTSEFDPDQVNKVLSPQADSFEKDEGFVMVPLEPLFKSLFTATANANFKNTIKKLNANRSKLFLDQSLPVEVSYEEVQVEEPGSAPPAPAKEPPADDLKARAVSLQEELSAHLETLRAQTEGLFEPEPDSELLDKFKTAALIHGEPALKIKECMTAFSDLVDRTLSYVTSIVESLSFQDLAGQKIQKIVVIMTDFQIQLLKLLVSFKSRMRVEEEQVEATTEEKQELAQRDVDDMLEKLGIGPVDEEVDLEAGPGAESRVDQVTVDSMLAELGF